MEFAFPEIENYTVYPRTFLRDVCVSFCFRPVLAHQDAIRNFISLRKEFFNIPTEDGAELKPREEMGTSVIKSEDNQVIFRFYRNAVSLKMRVPSYKKFADLMIFMPTVVAFLESQGVDEVECLRITKFNETQYGFQSDSSYVETAMKGIFSAEMMEWENFQNPNFVEVARWERRIDFSDDLNHAKAMVMYGFIKDDTDRKKGSLTLKTSVELMKPVDLGSLDEILKQCNKSVDSAFHWAVSDDILKAMQEK